MSLKGTDRDLSETYRLAGRPALSEPCAHLHSIGTGFTFGSDESGLFQQRETPGVEKPSRRGPQGEAEWGRRGRSAAPRVAITSWRTVEDHELSRGRPGYVEVGLGVGFFLHQFSAVLKLRDASGRPYVLIGGQAVNYWAERYLPTEPELEPMQPFTSEDIDFAGKRDDVQRIAADLGLPVGFPPRVAMSALCGTIPFKLGDMKSNIEVVRRIPGVDDPVESLAVEAELHGSAIRVLDPISLLACKLELVARISQKERHDLLHIRIYVPCVRGFLREFLDQVEQGNLPAKGWLGAATRVLRLTTSPRARRLALKHRLPWQEILPIAELESASNPSGRVCKLRPGAAPETLKGLR